jgi:hypothetical protein
MDLETYVNLVVALSHPEAEPERVLASHGLDEDAWDAIDAHWQGRIDEALATESSDVMPPLVEAYAKAFARAQRRTAGEVLPFDKFVEVTRAVTSGEPMAEVLKRNGLTLERFLKTQQHWTTRMVQDEELARRFRAVFG